MIREFDTETRRALEALGGVWTDSMDFSSAYAFLTERGFDGSIARRACGLIFIGNPHAIAIAKIQTRTNQGQDSDRLAGAGREMDLSIVIPAHNEEANIAPLIESVERAVGGLGLAFEVVIVDDASTDGTQAAVLALMPGRPWLRCVALPQTGTGRGHGQSAAFGAGFQAARGRLIALMDADLQNDPDDLPAMLDLMQQTGADLVQGDRSRARCDRFVRRAGSAVGRFFRRLLLGDRVRDTGCSLRLMTRGVACSLPMELAGMHRFIPVLARDMGFRVVEMPVRHHPRMAGQTKYGMGIVGRALPGLADCLAVRYMRRRRRRVAWREVSPSAAGGRHGGDAASSSGSHPPHDTPASAGGHA